MTRRDWYKRGVRNDINKRERSGESFARARKTVGIFFFFLSSHAMCILNKLQIPFAPQAKTDVLISNLHSPFAEGVSRTLQGLWHLVVYGNSNKTQILQNNSTIHMHVRHDSIDFTGVIAVVDHFSKLSRIISFDRIFYMHDTMFIHNRSAFVESLAYYSQVRTCSLQMGQSMNIGIYSVRALFRSKSILRALRGRDNSSVEERLKQKKKGFRGWEGILFSKHDAWASFSKCGCELSKGPDSARFIDRGMFQGRKELRYEAWGFSKFQSAKKSTNTTRFRVSID